jgi:hypothetical protein
MSVNTALAGGLIRSGCHNLTQLFLGIFGYGESTAAFPTVRVDETHVRRVVRRNQLIPRSSVSFPLSYRFAYR